MFATPRDAAQAPDTATAEERLAQLYALPPITKAIVKDTRKRTKLQKQRREETQKWKKTKEAAMLEILKFEADHMAITVPL